MTGWQIFKHSLFLVRHNLRSALIISVPMIVAMVWGNQVLGTRALVNVKIEFLFGRYDPLEFHLSAVLAGIWVAVAWHRFVLLEEQGRFLPRFPAKQIAFYILAYLGVTMAALGAGFGLELVILILSKTSEVLYFTGVAVSIATGFWLFFRLSPILPSAALGYVMSPRQAWRVTARQSGKLFFAGLLVVLSALIAAGFALLVKEKVNQVAGLALFALFQWVAFMVWISTLTTIYGILVEKRSF